MKISLRSVRSTCTAPQLREGAGFLVRRPIPCLDPADHDPILLIDEMGPTNYGPDQALGAPDHPHRGFETITYMLKGEFEHVDSSGHRDILRPGDVQWMTAGAGVIHSEMPSAHIRRKGGVVHGFQIWVNLPAKSKRVTPRYRHIPGNEIPINSSQDGLARGLIISDGSSVGDVLESSTTPLVLQDWEIQPGGKAVVSVPQPFNAVAYCYSGSAEIGSDGTTTEAGVVALLGPGDAVPLAVRGNSECAARILLIGGIPIHEPIAWRGPFVMNTENEILEAIADYQAGRFTPIPAKFEKNLRDL